MEIWVQLMKVTIIYVSLITNWNKGTHFNSFWKNIQVGGYYYLLYFKKKVITVFQRWINDMILIVMFLLQSDIVHQSVYELVHSEDREELQRQLLWNSFLPTEVNNLNLQDVLRADRAHLLERSFTVRFRCLLDNTSGFLVSHQF